jgi:hypothetical protein
VRSAHSWRSSKLNLSDEPTVPSPAITEMVPIDHEISELVVRTMVFALPPAAVVVGGWLAWGGALHWQDLLVIATMYTLTGLGITVGYHRLFTHRSFKTTLAGSARSPPRTSAPRSLKTS